MVCETSRGFRALLLLLFITALSAAPTTVLEESTAISTDVGDSTLSTELKPPPLPEKKEHQYVLFVINLYGVKNASGESSDEMFENEIIEKVPELTEPLATVLLIIEVDDDDEETDAPVDLDAVAHDLEKYEGFNVEKINHAGETKLLRVKLDKNDAEAIMPSKPVDKMKKVRSRRTPCLKCYMNKYRGSGGGFGGGQPSYPSHPSYPSGGGCSTCGGNGGGGNSYASAQAQAGSSSNWGK